MDKRTQQQHRARSRRGFTLIELMVAMVVSSIVVLGVFAFSSIQQTTTGIHERNVRIQQALEGAMFSMGQDVRGAGVGWARNCTELRVWDAANNRLINPGGAANAAAAVVDDVTDEAYWVLRDGLQGHWDSTGGATFPGGGTNSSASPLSAADAFDVIVTEANYAGSMGVFTLEAPLDPLGAAIEVRTGPALDSTLPNHVAEVQQLFPPGSFVLLVAPSTGLSFRAEGQQQCILMQVTADVAAGGGAQRFSIPVANTSGFNNIAGLLQDNNGTPGPLDDWDPAVVNVAGASIVPLGQLRWSRYELDYSIARLPYLVRYDVIGFQQDVDIGNLGAVDYPHCDAGDCPQPGLHLPGSGAPPQAVAIGPMIEDMQVAVGCDGYTSAGVLAADVTLPDPEFAYEEVGPAEGPFAGLPNNTIDENTPDSGRRDRDEWLGNAVDEVWGPDCVWYGAAEYDSAGWIGVEGTGSPPPAFRMSPQSIRVTLVGSGEFDEEAGGLGSPNVIPVEDRPQLPSAVGVRQRFTLTERFAPENLRWRDPQIQ